MVHSVGRASDVLIETIYNKVEVKPFEEDPDTSQEVWEAKDNPDIDLFYTPTLLLRHLDISSSLTKLTEGIQSFPWYKKARICRSFKHLTLPEALVYYELMLTNVSEKTLEIELSLLKSKSSGHRLYLLLTMKSASKTVQSLELRYDMKTLKVAIWQGDTRLGVVRYVIRNNKLEEIQGTYRGQRFILDPVWKPHKKGDLREEIITFGGNTLK